MNGKGTSLSSPEVINIDDSSDTEVVIRRPARNGSYFSRFCVYVDSVRTLKKLRLLDEFVEEFWEDFGESCVLRTPDGKSFTVQLLKHGTRFYLTGGWERFCRGYCIDRGCSIVFQYTGDAIFDMILFGFSNNEIKYHYTSYAAVPTTLHIYIAKDQSNSNACSSKRLRRFLDRKSKHRPISNSVCSNEQTSSRCPPKTSFQGSKKGVTSKSRIRDINLKKRTNKKGQKRGSDQKSHNSSSHAPSFKTVLTEACLGKNGQLWIPKIHGVTYMKNFADRSVTLQSGSNMFDVTVCRGEKGMRFGHGWIGFAEACGFMAGCECLFELTDARRQIYNVQLV